MKSTYRILAYLVALEVAVQAAVMVWAIAGLGVWVDGGGVLDKSAMESDSMLFPQLAGIITHGINGMMVIPLLALALLVVSFFARFPGAVQWAGAILALVVVQVALGMGGHAVPSLGALHGLNAMLLFAAAYLAGRRVPTVATAAPAGSSAAAHRVAS